jgi:hypothetical protein
MHVEKEQSRVPNDWKYGFKLPGNIQQLGEMLYTLLQDLEMEWKMINNYKIRVRSVGFPERMRVTDRAASVSSDSLGNKVKFDINIFKDGMSVILDFVLLEGQIMIFLGLCARIHKSMTGTN